MWAALRAAWWMSDPQHKHLRLGARLLAMPQGQGLRVATFATFLYSTRCFVTHAASGTNDLSLPIIVAEAARYNVTVPQMIHINQLLSQGSNFTYIGALTGMLASTWKIHRYPGPRVGAVQQFVGSAAIGWFWAALGERCWRVARVMSNKNLRGKDRGQQGCDKDRWGF